MKKSLIALAVAGAFAAPAAMAVEFTPTLYQSIALSIDSNEINGVGATDGTDDESIRSGGGSTIGFKFTDDLGNGMSAEGFVHFTTNITSGHAFDVTFRNGYVGLSGNFGSVKLGTNEHVYEVGQIIDGWGSDWAGGNSVGFWVGAPTRLGISGWNFTRQDAGSLWWTSPSWGGFVFDAVYVAGEGGAAGPGTTVGQAEGVQLAAKWSNAAFLVSGAWADYSDYGQTVGTQFGGAFTGDTGGTQDATGIRITFVWSASWGNLGGSYNTMESEDSTNAAATKNEVDTIQLTGTFNLASGRIIVNYTQADDQDFGGVEIANSGADGFDIGYQHDLSASSYAFLRYEANEGDANYSVTATGAPSGKVESDALMLGLKVSY